MNMPKCVNIRCIFVDLCVCVLYALCSSSFFKVASTSRLNAKMAEKQLFLLAFSGSGKTGSLGLTCWDSVGNHNT